MLKNTKKYWIISGILIFLIYVFFAAQPIPLENILEPRWLASMESGLAINMGGSPPEANALIPFYYGNRFGYIDDGGQFILNRLQGESRLLTGTQASFGTYLSFSPYAWSEYEAMPSSIEVFNPHNQLLMTINEPGGYPVFLDGRTYIISSEQNSVSSLDDIGNVRWTYTFPAPLTAIDASAGYVLAGTLDGAIELLNDSGIQIFSFEPGGSRLSVIVGCAISKDGSMLAIISGIDEQRFLLIEKSGDNFRVMYHEFLFSGFRRPVQIKFIENDRKIVYERNNGLGIYDIISRNSIIIPIQDEIAAIDTGDSRYLFLIGSNGTQKNLICIKLPGEIIFSAPFRSEAVFLERRDSFIYTGGDQGIISFELGKR